MNYFVGIDVAKYKHTITILDQEGNIRKKGFDISNTLEGFNSLLNELGLLGQKEQIKIGMEATGHYMTCLAKFLNRNGYKLQIYNPFLIHRFKESETCNAAKTDKLDSLYIARYVSSHTFTSSPQLSYNIEQWEMLKASGAVFLPCSGMRYEEETSHINISGHYWTSNHYGRESANCLCLFQNDLFLEGNFDRCYGLAIRLVKNA